MQGRERDGTTGSKAGIVPDALHARGCNSLKLIMGGWTIKGGVKRRSVGVSTPFDAGSTP